MIVFVLISKRLFSFLGKQITDSTPPITDENGRKSLFDNIFGEIFNEKEDHIVIDKDADFLKTEKKAAPIAKPKIIENKINSFEIKEEDEFDLRKAVIYSTILNNPFIDKKI